MLSRMTVDTLEYTKKLEAAGVDRKQAEAHAQALRHAAESDLPSKADFIKLAARVDLLAWMIGANIAITLGVLWKVLR